MLAYFCRMTVFAKSLLLIRPAAFGFNPETAASNSFQKENGSNVRAAAQYEFDAFVLELQKNLVQTEIFEDSGSPVKPDAVFPNNWFSTHANGTLVLYPMQAANRRLERRNDIADFLKTKYRYHTVHDLSHYENEGKFLEGTGSIVFDHGNRIAYAALSPRTDRDVLLDLCEKIGYQPLVFNTSDRHGNAIYHTNVLLAVHPDTAVLCLDCIPDASDKRAVQRMLEISGKKIISISLEQLESFAGNMLFVKNKLNEDRVVLSEKAWNSLDENQQEELKAIASPITGKLDTIETCGGGSARCMLGELF